PVPVQAPLQPVKVAPAAGVAVSVTAVPLLKDAEQVAPQLTPAGALVTVQGPVPVQAPLQPVKVAPAAGVAVSVTAVPAANDAEHVVPQLMPAGALVTVPGPAPARLTVSAKDWRAKLAVTDVAAFIVTV